MEGWFVPLLLAILVGIASPKKSYDGHEVWRVNTRNALDKTSIGQIVNKYNLDVWSDTRSHVDIRVSPDEKHLIMSDFALNKLQFDAMIPDIGKLIKKTEPKEDSEGISYTEYNSYVKIKVLMKNIAKYNKNATLIRLGRAAVAEPIYQLKFSVGCGKPSVWFDFNIHAREWISGAVGVYGVNHLSEGYGTDPDVTALLDKYDVYIIPIANPDGYAYSWRQDRSWRKNRNTYKGTSCVGIDLNRNFDDHFGEIGTSEDPCYQTYRGPSPASEIETQVYQAAILDLAANADLRAVFSVHAYSQFWMYPYSWTDELLPRNVDELERVAKIGVEALTAVYGTQYEYGHAATMMSPASGTTADFAYNNGINYSYTLQLRDKGEFGFLLPEDQILPTSRETWAGLFAAALAI